MSEAIFNDVVTEYREFLAQVGLEARTFVPISARSGYNVATRSPDVMPWYAGPAITEMLDQFEPPKKAHRVAAALPGAGRLPV